MSNNKEKQPLVFLLIVSVILNIALISYCWFEGMNDRDRLMVRKHDRILTVIESRGTHVLFDIAVLRAELLELKGDDVDLYSEIIYKEMAIYRAYHKLKLRLWKLENEG